MLQCAGSGVVSAFVELGLQLEPAVSVNVIPLHRPLRPLELLEFDQGLITSPSNCVNIPVVPLSVCEIGPTSVHELALFQHIFLQNVLVILARVSATHHKGTKPHICNYGLIALGLHCGRYFNFSFGPWILCVSLIQPKLTVQEVAKLIATTLRFTAMSIFLSLSLLPFYILKVKVNETWPH
jgi:hypothetical protein